VAFTLGHLHHADGTSVEKEGKELQIAKETQKLNW